jgi:DNA modification methylase
MILKKLDISWKKTCNCSSNHLNCLTAKEWIKCQLGVWRFGYEGRDVRDKEAHPATFPLALAAKAISLFTHKGELVVDPFVGSGTTLLAAKDLGRNAVGFDINEQYIKLCKKRLEQKNLNENTQQIPILDDARNMSDYLENESVSLLITSPPYANLLNRKRLNKSRRGIERKNGQYLKIEQYSQDERDLGILGIDEFSENMTDIYRKALPLLRPSGHNVINVADIWWEGKRIPVHVKVVEAMQKAGYELRNTIIWDKTNIVNNIGIFGWPSNYITMGTTIEFILDFWKPKAVYEAAD